MQHAGAAEALRATIRRKRFPAVGDAPVKTVLEDLVLDVPAGSFTVLFGPSGCGKTTTLNLLAGLDTDFDGEVVRQEGARIAFVFQEPRLLPWRTVEDNLRLVLPEPDEAIIDSCLRDMRLADVRKVFPTRLSLGMARRVALARAFVIRPTLLLLDEPFVSLDEPAAQRLRRLLLETLERHPATVLFVTHNLREAIALASRIVFLSPTPAGVLHEVDVPLTREERLEEAAVDSFRRELMALDLPGLRLRD
jgi:ABC-type nitrate/sulfonate/bicarbonate transport system ATPase subunit